MIPYLSCAEIKNREFGLANGFESREKLTTIELAISAIEYMLEEVVYMWLTSLIYVLHSVCALFMPFCVLINVRSQLLYADRMNNLDMV